MRQRHENLADPDSRRGLHFGDDPQRVAGWLRAGAVCDVEACGKSPAVIVARGPLTRVFCHAHGVTAAHEPGDVRFDVRDLAAHPGVTLEQIHRTSRAAFRGLLDRERTARCALADAGEDPFGHVLTLADRQTAVAAQVPDNRRETR